MIGKEETTAALCSSPPLLLHSMCACVFLFLSFFSYQVLDDERFFFPTVCLATLCKAMCGVAAGKCRFKI
jgi:hypothetical protein